jgi:holliday junction DNA helicase RuvA
MISYLSGKILNKGKGFAIIKVGDIGYKVFVSPSMFTELEIDSQIALYTHQYVREDALDLFGFRNMEELEMFELLLSISGVGPKSALGSLSVSSVDQLKESISRGDPSLLTKVSGIGRKTAERIVLELRDKISITDNYQRIESGVKSDARADEIDALMALGYSLQNAREALRQADPSLTDSGDRIREALKKLGR